THAKVAPTSGDTRSSANWNTSCGCSAMRKACTISRTAINSLRPRSEPAVAGVVSNDVRSGRDVTGVLTGVECTAWSGQRPDQCSPTPIDARQPREVDAERGETRTLRADAAAEVVPVAPVLRRPADFGHGGDAWKQHELVIRTLHERLGPQRRLDAEDVVLADSRDERRRIPVVDLGQGDVSRPVEAEDRGRVVLHVEVQM